MSITAFKPESHPGPLHVKCSGDPRQYEIASDYMHLKGNWDDDYVSFSGFFGSYGPQVFAAAPEMLEALKLASAALGANRARDVVDAAIAKAEASPC